MAGRGGRKHLSAKKPGIEVCCFFFLPAIVSDFEALSMPETAEVRLGVASRCSVGFYLHLCRLRRGFPGWLCFHHTYFSCSFLFFLSSLRLCLHVREYEGGTEDIYNSAISAEPLTLHCSEMKQFHWHLGSLAGTSQPQFVQCPASRLSRKG